MSHLFKLKRFFNHVTNNAIFFLYVILFYTHLIRDSFHTDLMSMVFDERNCGKCD